MKVSDKNRKYVTLNQHEWLELAAHLPRGHRLREYAHKRSEQSGVTWAEFTPNEWALVEAAARDAGIDIEVGDPS